MLLLTGRVRSVVPNGSTRDEEVGIAARNGSAGEGDFVRGELSREDETDEEDLDSARLSLPSLITTSTSLSPA